MPSSLKLMQNRANSAGLKSIYNTHFHTHQALLFESLHKLVKNNNNKNNFVANVMFLEDIQQKSGKNNSKFIVEKGSIGINGVSLTVSKLSKNVITLTVIPHTLKLTNLLNLKTNSIINIELDIFAKYLKKINN